MKKSITLAALLLALSTSVFAATPAKSTVGSARDEVSFTQLKSDNGFGIQVDKETSGKSIVIFYDNDHIIIFKDLLSKGASAKKGYVLSDLAYGDYTVEVVSKNQTVTKQLHVYDDGQSKSYFFMQ